MMHLSAPGKFGADGRPRDGHRSLTELDHRGRSLLEEILGRIRPDCVLMLEVFEPEGFMAGGQDHLKGRIIRLGHMGHVDYADVLAGLYALRQAFKACGGHTASRDYLEAGLTAYEQALDPRSVPGEEPERT